MKTLLTQNEVLEIVAPDPGPMATAAAQMQFVLEPADIAAISDGFKKGFYKSSQINLDGKPLCVVYYHLTDRNYLFLNFLASVQNEVKFSAGWTGVKILARSLGAKGIEFSTLRRPMIIQALKHGCKIAGALLEINL